MQQCSMFLFPRGHCTQDMARVRVGAAGAWTRMPLVGSHPRRNPSPTLHRVQTAVRSLALRRPPANHTATLPHPHAEWAVGDRPTTHLHFRRCSASPSTAAPAMPPDRDRPEEGSSAEKRPMLALPIPTYEEATSSRNSIADGVDDERAQLLTRGDGGSASGAGNYRPPTVESARTSTESSFLEEFASARSSSEASLRREMEQMEVGEGTDDGEEGGRRRRRGLRHKLSSRISSLGSSLSALSLPGGWGWGRGWLRVPSLPQMSWLHGSLVPVYRLIAVLLALVVVYALLASDVFSFRPPMSSGLLGPFDPASVRAYARQAPRPEAILESLRYLTSFDHIAGTEGDYVQAKWVHGKLASFGLDAVDESKYYVYLNYPIKGGRRVAVEGLGWEANLEEPIMDNNHENTLAFHGNSKAGTAEGPLVYANYGAREDFETLEKQGISVKGAIVLVRYGGTQGDRALKIKAAENHGAIGVLIFSDPKTEGWNWPGNALQRGGVSLMSFITGDVLTPGYPATKDAERVPKEGNPGLVQIPSLPLVCFRPSVESNCTARW